MKQPESQGFRPSSEKPDVMNLVEHDQRDDMKVWLSESELERLINQPEKIHRQIAFALAGRSGLRSHEILAVKPKHVHETDVGTVLSVPEGKGDKYRETPIPQSLSKQIDAVAQLETGEANTVVPVTATRRLRAWIQKARDQLAEDTDDDRWKHATMHDLRRTWASALSNKEVDALVVCQWGGWNDLETFLEHYDGAYSPEAQKREREKVDWL